jgi:hypothetical protein
MPDGGSTIVGGIAKLTMEAFSDAACKEKAPDAGDPIVVLINPESYSESFGVKFTRDDTIASNGLRQAVEGLVGDDLVLELILDGTGAVPSLPRKTVAAQVLDLRRLGLTLTKGNLNYLLLTWGTLRFKCRMRALKITYTLFNPDGSPLRAKVSASFKGVAEPDKPKTTDTIDDGGRYITLKKKGDLERICKTYYGDSSYVLDVASRNQLDSFRNLPPGTVVYFPPIEELKG